MEKIQSATVGQISIFLQGSVWYRSTYHDNSVCGNQHRNPHSWLRMGCLRSHLCLVVLTVNIQPHQDKSRWAVTVGSKIVIDACLWNALAFAILGYLRDSITHISHWSQTYIYVNRNLIFLLLIFCSLDLTWRDVQYVIVATANPDPLLSSENFTTNGAGRKCKRHVMFPSHVPQTTR